MSESEKQLRKLNDKIHKAIQNNLNEYLVLLQNVIGTKAGDIILYESAKCEHGREETFGGTYFRNFYVHYKLKDWTYAG